MAERAFNRRVNLDPIVRDNRCISTPRPSRSDLRREWNRFHLDLASMADCKSEHCSEGEILVISYISRAGPTCGPVYRGSSRKPPVSRRNRYEFLSRLGDRAIAHRQRSPGARYALGQARWPPALGTSCHILVSIDRILEDYRCGYTRALGP